MRSISRLDGDLLEPTKEQGQEETDNLQMCQPRATESSFSSFRLDGVNVATFHGFDLNNQPLVSGLGPQSDQLIPARSTISLRPEMAGARVVLVFEDADQWRPIVLGVIQDQNTSLDYPPGTNHLTAQIDDERVVITAGREVVLKCGDASLTLTRSGKVLIKGNYVLSRSTGYNKIKGAAVGIN